MATIVFSGGGSAGHIEPALAVARAWRKLHPSDVIVFIGTKFGLENILVPSSGFTLAHIPKVAISRKPSRSWFNIPFNLIAAVRASRIILKDADLLFGFGGYVSGPAYIAARLSAIPIVIHEANVKPGWANRLGGRLTPHVAIVSGIAGRKFAKAHVTGLPLRSDVEAAFSASAHDWGRSRMEAKGRLGFDQNKPLIFIMGGSQGSVAINKTVEGAIPTLLDKGFSILHSVGRANPLPLALGAYRPVAYVQAMADAYLASDLIIGRSGAVTCSEFRTLGRYALFIPLPVGNGEQFYNARSLVSEGRAEIIVQSEFTSQYLQSSIDQLLLRSALAPLEGSDLDVNSTSKIVALGESAISAR